LPTKTKKKIIIIWASDDIIRAFPTQIHVCYNVMEITKTSAQIQCVKYIYSLIHTSFQMFIWLSKFYLPSDEQKSCYKEC